MQIPTVKIVNPLNSDYWLTINESDYDPEKHVLWENREAIKPKPRGRRKQVEDTNATDDKL